MAKSPFPKVFPPLPAIPPKPTSPEPRAEVPRPEMMTPVLPPDPLARPQASFVDIKVAEIASAGGGKWNVLTGTVRVDVSALKVVDGPINLGPALHKLHTERAKIGNEQRRNPV